MQADEISLINHFNHLAATIFARPELDMAERQLGHAYNVDCDLDNFAAAVGFARQAITALEGDEGGLSSRLRTAFAKLTWQTLRSRVVK